MEDGNDSMWKLRCNQARTKHKRHHRAEKGDGKI